jgi:hypothetical protein
LGCSLFDTDPTGGGDETVKVGGIMKGTPCFPEDSGDHHDGKKDTNEDGKQLHTGELTTRAKSALETRTEVAIWIQWKKNSEACWHPRWMLSSDCDVTVT